jgi:hypothetical protein
MSNGRIIGPYNSSSIIGASGIWNLNDVHTSRKNESWPKIPSTLTFRTSTTGFGTNTALTLTHPVGVIAGDLCILLHYAYAGTDIAIINRPSGFTVLHNRAFNYTGTTWLSYVMSYEVLPDTTDVTLPLGYNTSTGLAGNPGNQSYVALYFYLNKTIESVKLLQASYNPNTGDPVARSITASTFTNVPLLVLGSLALSQAGSPAFNVSTSPAFDGTITHTGASNVEMAVGYKIYNTNPASDHTIDMDDIANQQLTSLLLSVQ